MSVFVALLRGINVGGKNSLPMKDLVRLFEALGCKAVRSYIQSGNIVFEASEALGRRLPVALSRAILEEAGLKVPVITRTALELAHSLRDNPYLRSKADPTASTSPSSRTRPQRRRSRRSIRSAPRPTSSSCAVATSTCICRTASENRSSRTLTSTRSSER
jgi:uncharacterized protein (DUF1697 family)